MKTKLKNWDVKIKDENTLFISLTDKNQTRNLILVLYRLSIVGVVPLSKLKAKFFVSIHDFQDWWHITNPKTYYELVNNTVNFKDYIFEFPTEYIIETNFANGILFKFSNEKQKKKLLSLLESAYDSIKL